MRRVLFIVGLLVCGLLAGEAGADTFKLLSGDTVSGEILVPTANDQGVQVKIGDGQYQHLSWGSLSQENLKDLAKNPKLQPFVEPFIEITRADRIKETQINIKQPSRLERPPRQSLLGAMLSSSVGIFACLLLYGATIYAGYEIALFRAQPPMLVCGLSAIPLLGVLAPIIFLSLPTKVQAKPAFAEAAPEPAPAEPAETAQAVAAADDSINPMQGNAEAPSGLRLHTEPEPAKPSLPETISYQRGQFTFNRRFFETKFPGFFGVVRRDADKDLVLVIKSGRGDFIGQRISRIAANDLHLEVRKGEASEDVLVPFQEIREIQLKHKDK